MEGDSLLEKGGGVIYVISGFQEHPGEKVGEKRTRIFQNVLNILFPETNINLFSTKGNCHENC